MNETCISTSVLYLTNACKLEKNEAELPPLNAETWGGSYNIAKGVSLEVPDTGPYICQPPSRPFQCRLLLCTALFPNLLLPSNLLNGGLIRTCSTRRFFSQSSNFLKHWLSRHTSGY